MLFIPGSKGFVTVCLLAVAEKVTPHGGPIIQRSRLVDETEPVGKHIVYIVSFQMGFSLTQTSQTQEVDEDLLQYYAFLADKGDMQAAVRASVCHKHATISLIHRPHVSAVELIYQKHGIWV